MCYNKENKKERQIQMTVKELKIQLEKYDDNDIIVIKENYIDRDGWIDTRKVYKGYITVEKPLDK